MKRLKEIMKIKRVNKLKKRLVAYPINFEDNMRKYMHSINKNINNRLKIAKNNIFKTLKRIL